MTCKFTFTAPDQEKVSLTLLHLDTEYGYDVLRVLDGIGGDDEKLGVLATMSGQEDQEAVVSKSSKMSLIFSSDENINRKGFKANVIAFKKAGENFLLVKNVWGSSN